MSALELASEDLAVLLAAVDRGSLGQAARVLRVSQSTASRRLARLEAALGARLFDRTPEGLAPTALALDIVPRARLVEGHLADIQRLAAGQEAAPRGSVRLALPDGLATAWLLPRLAGFYSDYPDVDVDLAIGHRVVDLVRREADIALRFVVPEAPDLVRVRLGRLSLAAVVHPSLAKADPCAIRWVQLADPGRQLQETRWIDTHIQPVRRMRVSLWHALFGAVAEGLAAGILAAGVAERAGLVRVCPSIPSPEDRVLYLVYHRALRDVPRVRALVDWLRQEARGFLLPSAGE